MKAELSLLCLGAVAAGSTMPFGCAQDRPVTPPDSSDGPDDALRDEAGFFEVPPQAHGAPSAGRLFYSFEVADADATRKPLVVFFAGGPGYPSSLDLLPHGVARTTLPDQALPGAPASNPARWTSFANLLFVDERQSGFSYGVAADDAARSDAAPCAFSPIDDAADAVRAVLQFLEAHRALRSAPVVLVGQSYGGERVSLALDLLLRYGTEASRADPALASEIQAHYDAVFPDRAGTVIDETLALSQFGAEVLLQPFVLGGEQYATQSQIVARDPFVGAPPVGSDPYDVRQPLGWSNAIESTACAALADPVSTLALLGVAPASIAELGPADRSLAFRTPAYSDAGVPAAGGVNAALTATLGSLDSADAYLVFPATACPLGQDVLSGAGSSAELEANLCAGVRTFVSNARYDAVIYSPAIPATLQNVATVTLDSAARAGVARPGWFTVAWPGDAGGASVEVRFPPYTDSGHFVAAAQPQELHDDVAAWLATP